MPTPVWAITTTDQDCLYIEADYWEDHDKYSMFFKGSPTPGEGRELVVIVPNVMVKWIINQSAVAEATASPSADVTKLYGTTDASVWACEFCRLFSDVPDEGAMFGWFANAIETGRDAERGTFVQMHDALEAAWEGFRLTCDEYAIFPRIEGWTWWDAWQKVNDALGYTIPERATVSDPAVEAVLARGRVEEENGT